MFPSPAQRTFRENFLARILAGIALVGAAFIGAVVYSEDQQLDPVFWVFAVPVALFFIYICIWSAKRRITIHQEGISYKSLMSEKDLMWEQIAGYRYGQQPVNLYMHFGLIGLLLSIRKGTNMQQWLEVLGPTNIKITANFRDAQEAMRAVLEQVNPRLREQAERTLSSGGNVSFGGIELSPAGVIWKGKEPIPYNAIVKCKIEGAFLRIKAEGKWLDNVAVNVRKVPNVFILLDLVEQRRIALGQKTAAAMAGSSASQYL